MANFKLQNVFSKTVTKETLISYKKSMFIKILKDIKHPEAVPYDTNAHCCPW